MPKEYKDYIELHEHVVGDERRLEMFDEIMKSSTFLPKTVLYKDIDEAFKEWVDTIEIKTDNGDNFPTMVLYTNQRFSEYSQSWEYTDVNGNLLLNFKTVNRENNPNFGNIHNRLWNVPGDRFYTMKKQIVLDDNGTESFLVLKMKQPLAVDLNYKLTIFTTQYTSINDFNTIINQKFAARQCYICPNGHYMPMLLENIGDESDYNIDDRQFYGQTFQIRVLAYLLTEDDFKVEQIPLKSKTVIPIMNNHRNIPDVWIEECNGDNKTQLTVMFPHNSDKRVVTFEMDVDLQIETIELQNIYNNYKVYIGGELQVDKPIKFLPKYNDKKGNDIKILISKQNTKDDGIIKIIGSAI